MRRLFIGVATALLLGGAGISAVEAADTLPQVLVRYKDGKAPVGRAGVRAMGAGRLRSLHAIGVDVVNVPSGQSIDAFMAQLKRNPDVENVEPNGVMRAFAIPNDPSYGGQYYMGSSYINIEAAWDITMGTSSVVVAVLDTGVSSTTDMANQFWRNPSTSTTSGLNGARMAIDWNNDGDTGDTDASYGPEQSASNDPTDNNTGEFHGTRVSHIIGAEINNSTGIAGVAPHCRIMGVKVLNANGNGSFDAIANGVIYAVDNGASVINMSLGGSTQSDTVARAIAYAIAHNVVVVAATGNSLDPPCGVNSPASIPDVIAVGATDSSDALAFFSCTGPQIDVSAPGVGIMSIIQGNATDSASPASDGTSFSSPMVAGIAALMRSLDPTMSVRDITRYIDFTAKQKPSGSGFNNNLGFGVVDAGAALAAAQNRTKFTSNPGYPGDSFPYPNPVHPAQGEIATIALPASMGTSGIKIDIYNTAGERVRTVSGTNEWDGKNDDGSFVASGLYIYYATTSAGNVKGKVTVIK